MEDQIDNPKSLSNSESTVPKKSSIKMIIWNVACIILFTIGVVFLIIFFDRYHHILILNYAWAIILSAIIAMVIIILCFFTSRTKIGAARFVALIIAAILFAANWFIYFRYIPKYGPADGCAIVKADPKYASATVEPQYYRQYNDNGQLIISTNVTYELKDNPFYEWGYILDVIEDGKVTEWIAFDPATGKYYVFHELKDQ